MSLKKLLTIALPPIAFACGETPTVNKVETCLPLKVTVDGQVLAGLMQPYGLALTQKMAGVESEQIQVFNHRDVTCEQVLSTTGRTVQPGEIALRANAGTTLSTRSIGIASHVELGVDVKLIGEKGSRPGDKVTMCVPETSFTPLAGPYKDKQVTVVGEMTGTWCGAMSL